MIIAKRLLRRALAVVYMSVGFFLILVWIWGDYIRVIPIVITYFVVASLLYGHVFRPLARYRRIQSVLMGIDVNVFKIFGFTASLLGLLAIATVILREYMNLPGNITPLMGILATIVSVIALLTAIIGSPRLLGIPEILVMVILVGAIILYLVKPSYVLPVTGASLIIVGMYTYWSFYLRQTDSKGVHRCGE